jgi:cysteine desulfurase
VPGIALNGPETRRLPGNLNLAFEGIDADALIAGLDEIALSTGSACSSASAEPSHVLKALGLPKERVAASVRIGLGRGTTEAEVDLAADRIAEEVAGLRAARQAVASPGAGR